MPPFVCTYQLQAGKIVLKVMLFELQLIWKNGFSGRISFQPCTDLIQRLKKAYVFGVVRYHDD